MTKDKVLNVIELYREKLLSLKIREISFPHKDILPQRNDILGHCLGMLDEMISFIKDERPEKALRWLGFIQGCFWTLGLYSVEELKNHNKPI